MRSATSQSEAHGVVWLIETELKVNFLEFFYLVLRAAGAW